QPELPRDLRPQRRRVVAPARRREPLRRPLVARLDEQREVREAARLDVGGGADDAPRRREEAGVPGGDLREVLVEADREGEGVGAEAGDAGQLEEDRK